MPIFFLIVGALLIIVAVNDKLSELKTLIAEDFQPSTTGIPGFHVWITAIFIAGSLGYVKSLRPLANAFLALILLSLVLSNRGFFAKLKSGIEGTR